MSAFDISMSSPLPAGFTGGLGGPGEGGHHPPQWYIEFGMDLGAEPGTPVLAAFDAHITRMTPHDPGADNGKVYGAQLFMRAPNDMMGGFYTHMTNVPPELAVGSVVARGDVLGEVFAFGRISAHLHMAVVEIIGGAPGGQYRGVDLYRYFLDAANTGDVATVTFPQDGTPPTVSG